MVLVFHPGIQHSHQLSWALNDIKFLELYISGVPVSNGKEKSFSENFSLHNRTAQIPVNRKIHIVVFSILRKIIGKIFGFKAEQKATLIFDIFFDLIVSVYVKFKKPLVVIGYENASFFTFKQVKKYSGHCILDAAGIHYSATPNSQNSLIGKLVEIRKFKEQEIADLIFCCSNFAKHSYMHAGLNENKLYSLALGVEPPSSQFGHSDQLNCLDGLTIVYAGSISYAKGVDIVISAIKSCIEKNGSKILLTLVGRVLDRELLKDVEDCNWITHIDYVDQDELFGIMIKNDISILFSRNDSFGMVVPEAMSCACPVIVSDHVGAKEIIEQYPDSGWVVELDVDKLAECLNDICQDKTNIKKRKVAAVNAAKAYTWENYRCNLQSIISDRLELWGALKTDVESQGDILK